MDPNSQNNQQRIDKWEQIIIIFNKWIPKNDRLLPNGEFNPEDIP